MADLIKESIAEAKALREIAIENAKASLAETFAPQIKNMISNRLAEGDDLFEEDELEDETETMDETIFEVDEEDLEGKEETMDEAEDEEMEGEAIDEEENPDSMYGDDLDEIIAELEKEVEGEDEMMEGEGMEEEEPEMKGEGYGKKDKGIEEYINELIAEMEGGEEDMEEEEPAPTKEQVEELEDELKEAYKTISFLKGKMNEAMLINSKLLYSGKIFRSYNLNESQKVSILETFDRATTIRETKLLYASLSTTLKEIKSNPNKKVARLKESRASKATLSNTKPAKEKVLEENKVVSRLQQLAGII
jgi:hypothetical protein